MASHEQGTMHMTIQPKDDASGLFTGNSSQTTREICEEVHSAFLAKHRIGYWSVAVVPFEHPGLRVVSQAPDGNQKSGVVQKTERFPEDLMYFLEDAYMDWTARTKACP